MRRWNDHWTQADVTAIRLAIKFAKLLEVGHRCEMCGRSLPLDLHEIIERAHTVQSAKARYYSYAPELTALLCRECHSNAGLHKQTLLRKNMVRYRSTFRTAVNDLLDALPSLVHQFGSLWEDIDELPE